MNVTEEEALRQFPELQALITARQAGWNFWPIGNKERTELLGIVGSYSREKYTDALWIYDRSSVVGVRLLADSYGGGVVWQKHDGTLEEIVYELIALPEPDHRLAPTLVKRPGLLWTPS